MKLLILLIAVVSFILAKRKHIIKFGIEDSEFEKIYEYLQEKEYDVLGHFFEEKKHNVEIFVSGKEMEILFEKFGNQRFSYKNGINGIPKGYRTLDEINQIMNSTAAANPDLVQMINLNPTNPTVDGRNIYAVKFSDPAVYSPKHNLVIFSDHHAREIVTPEIAVQFIKNLEEGYHSKDKQIMGWLQDYNIYVVPVVNVDGYSYLKTNAMWRKNRKKIEGTSSYGVDLNRNYQPGWDKCAGSSHASSETYKGEKAFSEVESQTVKAFVDELKFAKVLDFHSYGNEVLHIYTKCLDMPSEFRELSAKYAKELASEISYGTRFPSADGEEQEYSMLTATSFAFLTEVGRTFQPSFEEAGRDVQRVMPLVYKFVDYPIPFRGVVYDSKTQKPIPYTDLKIEAVTFYQGESRQSNNAGAFHLFVPYNVDYTITFSKEGYQSKSVEINVKEGESFNQDIYLERM